MIYNERCEETLGRLKADTVDLVLTSPPYDNLRTYNGFTFDVSQITTGLFRVLKPGGVVVWVVTDQTVNGSETGTSITHAQAFMSVGFRLHDTMIYLKDNPPPVGGATRYYQAWEYMFVFSKGAPKTFNPLTTPRRNKHNDKRTQRFRAVTRQADGSFIKKIVKVNESVKCSNVWKYVVGGGTSVPFGIKHPAVFPLQLAKDHVNTWTHPGDLVYDPFLGSGTTAIAAETLRRSWIGSEISVEYCQVATERIATEA